MHLPQPHLRDSGRIPCSSTGAHQAQSRQRRRPLPMDTRPSMVQGENSDGMSSEVRPRWHVEHRATGDRGCAECPDAAATPRSVEYPPFRRASNRPSMDPVNSTGLFNACPPAARSLLYPTMWPRFLASECCNVDNADGGMSQRIASSPAHLSTLATAVDPTHRDRPDRRPAWHPRRARWHP
jgi:hypothetical protein